MPSGKGIGAPCPNCSGPTRVRHTRLWEDEGVVFRQRECKKCGHKFDTLENPITHELISIMKKEKST